ncbi:unnamed protein product, partial [Fusarium fujikuroi]
PYQHKKNINQIWSVFSIPGKNILIKSEANQQWLVATGTSTKSTGCQKLIHQNPGYCQPTSTGNPHWSDESAQWIIQGGNIHNLNNKTDVSIWNKQYADCVLDVEGGNGPGSPILAYKYHGGPNQIFRLWKRS